MTVVKRSPLCSADDGREIFLTAKTPVTKFRLTVPRELLDDECGDAASETERKTWVETNIPQILAALPGSITRPPFDRIRIEEIT